MIQAVIKPKEEDKTGKKHLPERGKKLVIA